MALFGVGRGKARDKEAVPGPEVFAPRRGLDGWTLEGTPLAARFERDDLRELATLLHGVCAGMDTAYTYERAADMLDRAGERPQALAVLDAYFGLPERIHEANPGVTRNLARRRQRLRKRLGVVPRRPAGAAPLALPAGSTGRPLAAGRAPLALPPAPTAPPPRASVLPPMPDKPPKTIAAAETATAIVIPPRPTRPALPAAPPEPGR
ncbi:hypothetical protein LO772_12715 [Yinghuangia sp. ASG 101]|uniref:hypothetical protein n=1 Tax=Yinghuangia sp. ASG 101 TaxID=2896848 RepID=UPI001E4333D7|nr:hypothetical protein [Yinghuangia sp. ASG 101]UGQ14367.1 hypothetical protein LO772_12715 [Yinghuangia sp. ASG 101]